MNLKAFLLISFTVLITGFSGCKSVKNNNSKPAVADLGIVPAPPTAPAKPDWLPKNNPYQPAQTILTDLVHTKLRVSFDWQKQYLFGEATLTLKPHFYPQNNLILDARGFEIKSIKLLKNDKDLAYTYENNKITITLDKTYSRTEKYEVVINYVAKPNELETSGSAAITSDKGLYFINPLGEEKEKPRQIWTQGETQANSAWFPTIDAPNQKMTQEIYITIEKNFTTLSNGSLIYSKNNPNGTRTDYWKQELPHAPYLAMMAIGEFAVVKDSWKNKEVDYYVEPKYKNTAKAVFGNTPEMLSFFSKKLGVEYPWDKYAQVVVRDYVSGAMENTSATLHNEGLNMTKRELLDKNWDDYIAHELFHQWFGDLVTTESWSNLPLNESFGTYGEYLWSEFKYGSEEADLIGQKDLNNYLREAENKQESLIRYRYEKQEDMFDNHSYAKGGRVLHMLRKYVGDEAFFASLNKYLTANKFKAAEISHLRLAFEEVTGEDLQWFFDQWFMKSGHPQLQVSKEFVNGKLRLHVEQIQDSAYTPIYKLPLKIAIWENGKKTEYPITITKAVQFFEFSATVSPDLVVFDSEAQLLGTVEFEKTKAELIYQFYHADKYLTKYEALEFLAKKPTDPEVMKVLQDAMKAEFWRIRDMAVYAFNPTRRIFSSASKEAEEKFTDPEYDAAKKLIREIALTDPKTSVRAEAISTLGSYRSDLYLDVFTKSLNDSSYAVAAAGIDALAPMQNAATYLPQLAALQKTDNSEVVSALGNFYAYHGDASQFNWFEKQLRNLPDYALNSFVQAFAVYLLKLPTTEKQKGISALAEIARSHKTYYVRLGAYQSLAILSDQPGVTESMQQIKQNEKDERLIEYYKSLP